MSHYIRDSTVIGPEGAMTGVHGEFTDKVPPPFSGRESYRSYRNDVELRSNLTNLAPEKQGPELLGRLRGEAKNAAATLPIKEICGPSGLECVLTQLDKSYAVDESSQLDSDLATFLDYTWDKNMTVEKFIAGFHARHDMIAELQFTATVQGHMMLRQAGLDSNEQNMIVGQASGDYDVRRISSALRSAYRNKLPYSAFHNTHPGSRLEEALTLPTRRDPPKYLYNTQHETAGMRNHRSSHRSTQHTHKVETRDTGRDAKNMRHQLNPKTAAPPSFYHSYCSPLKSSQAIVDPWACASIIGDDTLRSVQLDLDLPKFHKAEVQQDSHRFGDSPDRHKTLFAVKIPFVIADRDTTTTIFEVSFDVISGKLPALIGAPALRKMKSNINFGKLSFGLMIGQLYQKFHLNLCQAHVALPFKLQSMHRPAVLNQKSARQVPRARQSWFTTPGATCPTSISLVPEYVDQEQTQVGPISAATKIIAVHPVSLAFSDLKKIHLHLRHGSKTAIIDYLRLAGRWSPTLAKTLDDVIRSCSCALSTPPDQHAPVSSNPPTPAKHEKSQVDVVFFESTPFLRVIDLAMSWSEVGRLRTRSMSDQCAAFLRLWVFRHGPPKLLQADNEYNNMEFRKLCDDWNLQLNIVAANHHEANGGIERANHTLRMTYNRLRAIDRRSCLDDIVMEATSGKHLIRGSKAGSAFELMYVVRPRISDDIDHLMPPPATVSANREYKARHSINLMLRKAPHASTKYDLLHHLPVYFWRDEEGWLGPADIIKITENEVVVLHNNQKKTTSFNRVRQILPEHAHHYESDDEVPQAIPRILPPGTRRTTSDPHRTSNPATGTVSRRELRSIQKDTNRMLDGWAGRMNNETEPITMDLSADATSLPRRSERIAEKTASSDSTHLLMQLDITNDEKRQAYQNERDTWSDKQAFVLINHFDLPPQANITGSHTILKRKDCGRVKARTVRWGHRDIAKQELRSDSPCLNLEIFRLVLSITAEQKWDIAQMDITVAFLQARGFNREVFLKPPKEEPDRSKLWRLTAAAYGLADSGRLWYLTSDSALTTKFGLTRSRYEPTLYYKRSTDGALEFLLITQVDNCLYSGSLSIMKSFENFLQQEFDVGELDHCSFRALGCEIDQIQNRSIVVTQMNKYGTMDIDCLRIDRSRNGDSPATQQIFTPIREYWDKCSMSAEQLTRFYSSTHQTWRVKQPTFTCGT